MDQESASVLFDVISGAEACSFDLDDVNNLLYIFHDLLQDAVSWVDPQKPHTVDLFNRRIETITSILTSARMRLTETQHKLSANVIKGYDIYQKIKAPAQP